MERKNINNLNTLNHIPVNKVKRATSLVSAGVKLSGNYLRYYGEKVLKVEGSRGRLDKKNARDIYDSLKTLKGSALKVAQMLSMENNLLPSAYVEQFSLSQFSVPPLSWPLVNKLVKKYLGKSAHLIFDTFDGLVWVDARPIVYSGPADWRPPCHLKLWTTSPLSFLFPSPFSFSPSFSSFCLSSPLPLFPGAGFQPQVGA